MNTNKIPNHIAIIMDGNRRWAKSKNLSPIKGHQYAADKTIEPLVETAAKLNIKYITFWAWSTENWKRNKNQVKAIMHLFQNEITKSTQRLNKKQVKINIIGDISKFSPQIIKGIKKGADDTKLNTKITATFALNYGGRDDILRAVNKLIAKNDKPLTQKDITNTLDTKNLPDPDFIIRTGGEQRLSGFLLWQSQYSELYFTPTLFPDFTPKQLLKAINEYKKRQRRFGQ